MKKIDSDCLPYAFYYDKSSIITKNGMILQTVVFKIKINDSVLFRQKIREFIRDNFDKNIAIYFHTIKHTHDDKSIFRSGNFEHIVFEKINNLYKINTINEIFFSITYVTKIHDEKNKIIRKNSKFYHESIRNRINNLNEIVNKLLKEFGEYIPIKLGISEKNEAYKMDHASFLSKLINFDDSEYNIDFNDVSEIVNQNHYTFGKNKIKIKTPNDQKYVKIFNFKEYSELNINVVYQIIQNLKNITITQIVMSCNNKSLIPEYKKIFDIYDASNDSELKSMSNFEYIQDLIAQNGSVDIYAKSQLIITICADSLEELEKESEKLSTVFLKNGIITFVEDVNLESSFLSMIPGNFRFIGSLIDIPIDLLAGFTYAEGSNFEQSKNYLWSKILFNLEKTNNYIYPFGIHKDFKNTMIIGDNSNNIELLKNLIITGCMKNKINVVSIENTTSNDCLSRLCMMDLFKISCEIDEMNKIYSWLNPFDDLMAQKSHLEYVISVLKLMLNEDLNEEKEKEIESLAKKILSNNKSFENVIKNSKLNDEMLDWLPIGKYDKLFRYDLSNESFLNKKGSKILIGKDVINDPILLNLVSYVLCFKISLLINTKKPLIIVIDNCFRIFQSEHSTAIFEQILDIAKDLHNVAFLFTMNTEEMDFVLNSPAKEIISNSAETKIHFFNTNLNGNTVYQNLFHLNEKDANNIANNAKEYGSNGFCIATPYEKHYIKFNLSDLEEDLKILNDKSGEAREILYDGIIDVTSNRSDRMYEMLIDELKNHFLMQ